MFDDSRFTYLWINLLSISIPMIASFHPRLRFYREWPALLPALVINGLFFLAWDAEFTRQGVWGFNPSYVTGGEIWGMPWEEWLFFLAIPYSCLFIFHCLGVLSPRSIAGGGQSVSLVLIIGCAIIAIIHWDHLYTVVSFGLAAAIVAVVQWIQRPNWMSRFYLTYAISLLPFFIVNGLLTSLPVVTYDDSQNLGIRIGTIPLDDFFYSLSMLLLATTLWQWFRRWMGRVPSTYNCKRVGRLFPLHSSGPTPDPSLRSLRLLSRSTEVETG